MSERKELKARPVPANLTCGHVTPFSPAPYPGDVLWCTRCRRSVTVAALGRAAE